MFNLGGAEMGVLFIIVLLIFGPSQIPKLARGLGQAMREFRKAQHEITDEMNRDETGGAPGSPHRPADAKPPDTKPTQ